MLSDAASDPTMEGMTAVSERDGARMVDAAWTHARESASRSGVRVVELHDVATQHSAAELLRKVWRADSADSLVNANLLRALEHSGNYVVGAVDTGDEAGGLVGVAVGFIGEGHLHSHIAGVDPGRQHRGVGYALKQHQRAWALGLGLPEVRWTFDPLVLRNAYFNLHKLGATATAYLPDFYGPMSDGVNAGDASDRLYVSWQLRSERVAAAARGKVAEAPTAALRAGGAAVLLDRAGGRPVAAGHDPTDRGLAGGGVPADGRPVLVAVPPDIERVRAGDPDLAACWRIAVREALGAALSAGYRITGIGRDGFYLLEVVG
jgi:predicted GNAT superfamily acetyltransferase